MICERFLAVSHSSLMISVLWFSKSVHCIKIVFCSHMGALYSVCKLFHYNNWCLCKQAYYMHMYSQCLNVIFRATVDVRGVVKNGQADVVSSICQNSLCIWRIHCGCIIYPLKRQMVIIFQENYRINCFIATCHTFYHHQFAIIVHITFVSLSSLSISPSYVYHYCPYQHQFAIIVHITFVSLSSLSISPSYICHYCPYQRHQFSIIVHISIINLPLLSIT